MKGGFCHSANQILHSDLMCGSKVVIRAYRPVQPILPDPSHFSFPLETVAIVVQLLATVSKHKIGPPELPMQASPPELAFV